MGNVFMFPARKPTYNDSLLWLRWVEVYGCYDFDEIYRYVPVLYLPADRYRRGCTNQKKTGHINHPDKYLLYLHGNSCDLGNLSRELTVLNVYGNINIVAVEYPGYGITKLHGLKETDPRIIDLWAETVMTSMINRGINAEDILVMGRSIGTGPATKLANNMAKRGKPPGALILHQPFLSIHKLLNDYTFLGKMLIPDFWDNLEQIRTMDDVPLLIIHGSNDEIIDVKHSYELIASYYPDDAILKHLYNPDDMPHNEYYLLDDILIPLHQFLSSKDDRMKKTNQEVMRHVSPYQLQGKLFSSALPRCYQKKSLEKGCLPEFCSSGMKSNMEEDDANLVLMPCEQQKNQPRQ